MKMENKSVVITGAGSGMGRAMTELFVKEGAKIIAADINEKGVKELIETLGKTPGEITYCQTDVSKRDQVENMIDVAIEKYGRLDVLINNAGILDLMVPVGDLEDSMWEKVMAVNTNSVMYASRKAVNVMKAQEGGGCIVNTASIGGLNGCRAGAAYTASKFAVVGLTKNIGFMYAKDGIRCNAICPGSIETNIASGLASANKFGLEKSMAGMGANPRNAKPEEVAKVALFLASSEASFVNGTTVTVDGGWTAY